VVVHCRILNVGPDADARRLLGELAQTDGLVLQHIETGSVALEALSKLPEAELPHLVIIPFRLPILMAVDFISVMHSHQQLRSIPILVWGPETEAQEVDRMFEAGEVCVLLGKFGTMHLDAVRHLCRNSTGIEPAVAETPSLRAANATSQPTGEQRDRNVELGLLFVWAGCISAVFFVCAFPQLGGSNKVVDLAPLPVCGSLAGAGFSLMWRRAADRGRAHQ
jgi:CheY-like chemotaxis protein